MIDGFGEVVAVVAVVACVPRLRLCSPASDQLHRVDAPSLAGLCGGGCLPPLSFSSPVLQLVLEVADLLPLLLDLLPLHR